MTLRKGTRPIDPRRERILARARILHVMLVEYARAGRAGLDDGPPTREQVEAVLFMDDRLDDHLHRTSPARREHGVTP